MRKQNVVIFYFAALSAFGQANYTINTIAGTDLLPAGDGGPATAAQLQASGIAVDSQNNIFVVDGDRVRRIDRSGIIPTFFLREPHNAPLTTLAIDSGGNVYVGDDQLPTIKFAPDGSIG